MRWKEEMSSCRKKANGTPCRRQGFWGAGSLSQPRRQGPMRTDPEKSTREPAARTKFPMRRESFWRDSIVVAVIVVLGAYAVSLIANLGVGSVPASKAIETIGRILFLAVLILV